MLLPGHLSMEGMQGSLPAAGLCISAGLSSAASSDRAELKLCMGALLFRQSLALSESELALEP